MDIKKQIKIWNDQIKVREKKKLALSMQIRELCKQVDGKHEQIWRLQDKCKHEFPPLAKGEYGFMGKGICQICGYSDY